MLVRNLLFALVLALAAACGTPNAGTNPDAGGGSGGDSDAGGDTGDAGDAGSLGSDGGSGNHDAGVSDAGTDGGGTCGAYCVLGSKYSHTFKAHIMPTQLGTQFGFSDCTSTMEGNLVKSNATPKCAKDGCERLYDGTVTSFVTDCQGMSAGQTFNFAFAPEGAGNLKVWAPTDVSLNAYDPPFIATGDGNGTFTYEYTEKLGNGSFNLGETLKTYFFTVTAP